MPSLIRSIISFFSIRSEKSKKVSSAGDQPAILVTFRDLLMIRFYLRNTPTLFSVIMSGEDGSSLLYALNRLIGSKNLFDYIHSLTPQFTKWELQQHLSTDTHLVLSADTALKMIRQLQAIPDNEYIVPDDKPMKVWEGKYPEDRNHKVYVIAGTTRQPQLPCFEDLEFNNNLDLTPMEILELLDQPNDVLLICRKWHIKKLADADISHRKGTALN